MPPPISDPDPDVVASPETPAAPAAPAASQTSPTPEPSPVAPQAASQQPATTPSAPAYESARDFAAKALGYKADAYSDDESFLRAIIAESQTRSRQLDEARQLAQHYQYLQSQQLKPAAPASKPDPLAAFKAPEFNPAWLSMVEKDADGNLRPRPGADPTIIPKLHAYQQYKDEVAQKLTTDPMGFLKPIIENVAAERAQALIQEHFQKAQSEQYVNGFLKDNANWLLQTDSNNRIVTNPATGQGMLTPAGERFLFYMQEAERFGITHPVAQENYARRGLYAEMYAPQAQGNQAAAAGDAAKQQLLQQMNRNGNRNGSMVASQGVPAAEQNQNLSIKDRLRIALQNHSDADFAPPAAASA